MEAKWAKLYRQNEDQNFLKYGEIYVHREIVGNYFTNKCGKLMVTSICSPNLHSETLRRRPFS